MIKVTAFYPNTEGKKFDMAYYVTHHVPMVKQKFGSALKGIQIDQGVGGAQPGEKATYIALAHMLFDSVDAFQQAFGPNVDAIMSDVPNYTNIDPIIQINEVKL